MHLISSNLTFRLCGLMIEFVLAEWGVGTAFLFVLLRSVSAMTSHRRESRVAVHAKELSWSRTEQVTNGAVSHERKDQGASTVVPLRWVVAAGTARGRPSRRHYSYRTTFAYWHHNSYVNTRTELLVRVWLYGYEYCTENVDKCHVVYAISKRTYCFCRVTGRWGVLHTETITR